MNEQRKFHRVRMTETCSLSYQSTLYHGQLDNISLNGAVVSFTEPVSVPVGAICLLTVYLKETAPLRLNIEVIHSNNAMIGMRFVPLDEAGQHQLVDLVQRFSTEPEKLASELDILKWQIANYLRAS
ncbi:hypothetical protein GMST_07820 [Geomonas silvestris]|uniref:PilZ domain-containing protein n=1 Tax=Geomonas silvestris TaxID=2740184 RepID=A0A6V8MEP5_9BACT|nr:PilZ domain-containing protein [Geomonas silvestris]GFO58457.1 hypothetical protein GMST_07820 [Geomonas silvestris]